MILEKKILLGVGVTNATKKEILEYILQSLKKEDKKYYVVTPNPEILVYACKNRDFRTILNNARLALCDGVGVMWAGKFLGKNFKQRVTGTDFVENLCKEVAKQPITVGFLGGGPHVALKTAECLTKKYPGLNVIFADEEWNFSHLPHIADDALSANFKRKSLFRSLSERLFSSSDKTTNSDVTAFSSSASGQAPSISTIAKTKSYTLPFGLAQGGDAIPSIDLLFVAFGYPKQEIWISENLGKIPVKIAIGVGGAFDYLSGSVPRAPFLVRNLGFEWLFRLIVQSWRIKRQLALIEFMWLVFKERFRRMTK